MSRRWSERREYDRERGGRHTMRGRFTNFAGHWCIALLIFLWASALRAVVKINSHFQPGDLVVPSVMVLCITLGTVALAWRARSVGYALGRKPIFFEHVQWTIIGGGAILLVITIWGFSATRTLLAVFALMAGAISWNLHLTAALRADPRDNSGTEDGGWAELFGLPNTVVTDVERTEHAIKAKLNHGPGDTSGQATSALAKIEAAANAVSGRSRLVQGDNAGSSEITLVLSDPFKRWMELPGLSHPGGSFADPIRTSYYDTGEWEFYWYAHGRTADGEPRAAHSRLRMGMTRSGKTGEAKNEVAEVASRRDVVLLYMDLTKGLQGTGPLIDFLTCFADEPNKAKLLFAALKSLVRYRTDLMGYHGFTDWTPQAYEELQLPAVYVFMDEADEFVSRDDFVWLVTKGLSVGVFLSVTLPRADHKSMPPTARYSFGATKCFGVGDDYSEGFALTDEVRAAGASPQKIGIRIPGVHWHDRAPGISPQMYPVPLRSGRSDHNQLAEWVREARTGFVPATFTEEEIRVLNENGAFDMCQPGNMRAASNNGNGHRPTAEAPAQPKVKPLKPMVPYEDDGSAYEDEDEAAPSVEHMPSGEAGDAAEYAEIDPRGAMPKGRDIGALDDGKPAPLTPEQMASEFDRVVVAMAQEGMTVLRNKDLHERCGIWSETWVSRRLSRVAAGEVISPPGVTLERIEGRTGHYKIIYHGQPALAGR